MEKTYEPKHKITGKIIISAQLTTVSPVLVGKGEGDVSDIEIMRLPGGQPYIPASSFAGVLKQHFIKEQIGYNNENKKWESSAEVFWGSEQTKTGSENNKTCQSHVTFDDLLTTTANAKKKIIRRDAIKIDSTKGIVNKAKGAKYDFELLEPEVTFNLRAEITIRKEPAVLDDFKKYVQFIADILHDDNFRLGAQTNNGFGRLKCTCFNAWEFAFPENRKEWFDYLQELQSNTVWQEAYWNVQPPTTLSLGMIPKKLHAKQNFTVKAEFGLKSALIISSYSIEKDAPDKEHLRSNGRDILTGKAIKGAMWHRAEKILKTISPVDAENDLKAIFGYVNEEDKSAAKGKLRVEEKDIKNATGMEQTRIKIDRFTGGTMSGALFQSKPVWRQDNTKVSIEFTLAQGFAPRHAVLLLHLLKDLWTEDLAIGGEKNVGRGVLIGKHATIGYDNKISVVEGDGKKINFAGSDLKNDIIEWEKEYRKLYKIKDNE